MTAPLLAAPFTLSQIKSDPSACLLAVMEQAPLLSSEGWGCGSAPHRFDLAKARAELLTPFYVRQFIRAAEWLAAVPPMKGINRKASSYRWKHVAERWHACREGDGESYISNGAFVAGCLAMGRRIEPAPGSFNPFCAIPQAGVNAPLVAQPDRMQLAWLCEMAAVGCVHENRSAWAAQLRQDAAKLRLAEEQEQKPLRRRAVIR